MPADLFTRIKHSQRRNTTLKMRRRNPFAKSLEEPVFNQQVIQKKTNGRGGARSWRITVEDDEN